MAIISLTLMTVLMLTTILVILTGMLSADLVRRANENVNNIVSERNTLDMETTISPDDQSV
jgi:hypothetical protein